MKHSICKAVNFEWTKCKTYWWIQGASKSICIHNLFGIEERFEYELPKIMKDSSKIHEEARGFKIGQVYSTVETIGGRKNCIIFVNEFKVSDRSCKKYDWKIKGK